MDDDLRILVLGDEESPEDLIEYELSKSNLRFIALRVTSREAFLHALQESSPNLILVTTGCTGISGMTALALAQEICPGTPCFLIGGTGCQERGGGRPDRIDSLSSGVHGIHLEDTIASFFAATGITPLAPNEAKTLFETQDALQPLMHIPGVIITFLSPEGRILEFNRGAERLTGWDRHEVLGQDGIELFFPIADQTTAIVHLKQVLSGKLVESIDLPLKLRNGSTAACQWHSNLVSDRYGQPAGIMLVGQLLCQSKPWESQPRSRLDRSCHSPSVSRGRGLLTRQTGTC
jgi:PAS domain S-box-containing protein